MSFDAARIAGGTRKLPRSDWLRKLLIGALGLSLTSCSHSPQTQTTASCPETDGLSSYHGRTAGSPLQLASFRTRAVNAQARSSHAATSAKSRSNHPVADGELKTAPAKINMAKRESVAPRVPLPAPSPKTTEPVAPATPEPSTTATVPAVSDKTGGDGVASSPAQPQDMPARPRSVEEEVAVATENSERSSPPASADGMDRLMAVLVARLNVTSVSDLTGKTIAIDDTIMATSGKIRAAIVAAGATEVQLTEGSTIAIDRLMNGEVPAAIVALLPPAAAEAFPDIDGFRVFRVPLSPPSSKERP
jgi:hypothetical protein